MADGGHGDTLRTFILAVLATLGAAWDRYLAHTERMAKAKAELKEHAADIHHKRKKESKSAD